MSEIKEGVNYTLTVIDENVVIGDKVEEIIEEKPKRGRKKKD
jgi:hypothetical protein